MTLESVTIIPFNDQHQTDVDLLMKEINDEFSMPVSYPNYKPKQPDHYWIALEEDKVVGSVALNIEEGFIVLKRMFLKQAHRGKEKGISNQLMQTVFNWCNEHNVNTIYLGTMEQFIAAQKFYKYYGFIKITQQELPSNFSHNPIDNVFYKLVLQKTYN
ncbi:MAG: GNAT family N-acetyltransferase [Bacteroidota bacterium]